MELTKDTEKGKPVGKMNIWKDNLMKGRETFKKAAKD